MYFAVNFRYPEEERKARQAEAEKEKASRILATTPPQAKNTNYWANGSPELAPARAMDDGRFTYLLFPANRDMPAIFEELPDGTESLVNTNVQGSWIVIHRVVKRLILRRHPYVTRVENRSFDPNGISTPTGTVTDSVQRVIRDPRP